MIFLQLLISILHFGIANSDLDPNGYFHNRKWELKTSDGKKILINSKYVEEPVQTPNRLNAHIKCSENTKKFFIKDLPYCGIDSVSIMGKQLEVQFSDFDFEDIQGACSKKRKQSIPIPSC